MEQILFMMILVVVSIALLIENKRRQASIKATRSTIIQEKLSISKAIQQKGFKERLMAFAQEMGVEDNNSDLTISYFLQQQKEIGIADTPRFSSRYVNAKKLQTDSHLVKRVTTECRLLDLHHAVYLQIVKMKGDRNSGEVYVFAN